MCGVGLLEGALLLETASLQMGVVLGWGVAKVVSMRFFSDPLRKLEQTLRNEPAFCAISGAAEDPPF